MGIFSLFGKKDGQQDAPADKDALRAKYDTPIRSSEYKNNSRIPNAKRDPLAARATALKIDAIESEMSFEFIKTATTPQSHPLTGPNTIAPPLPPMPPATRATTAAPGKTLANASAMKPPAASTPSPKTNPPASTVLPVLEMGTTTRLLLQGESTIEDMVAPASSVAPIIEETAILYANGQTELVERMLMEAVREDNLGAATLEAWHMLFDLHQINGKQQAFENLSLEYASKFETSPPAWLGSDKQDASSNAANRGTTPMVAFSGRLDTGCNKLLDRLQKLAEGYRTLRLEFNRVTEVDPVACHLLLAVLLKLQKSGHDLILVGAPELAAKIRTLLEVGRRSDGEGPWLLLLEILRLLNREKEFEETSIDYCITFEVSPPAFIAPKSNVTTAAQESFALPLPLEGYLMPAVVEGRIDNLIVAIAAYSDEHTPAIINCSRLNRIDFNAAGRLLTGLAPFCGHGKVLEFHHVNHLVAALFNVIGLKDIVRIVLRKN